MHLKVNFHNGITHISLTLFCLPNLHSHSSILIHLVHLLWRTLFTGGCLLSRLTVVFFHFALLHCRVACVCLCAFTAPLPIQVSEYNQNKNTHKKKLSRIGAILANSVMELVLRHTLYREVERKASDVLLFLLHS